MNQPLENPVQNPKLAPIAVDLMWIVCKSRSRDDLSFETISRDYEKLYGALNAPYSSGDGKGYPGFNQVELELMRLLIETAGKRWEASDIIRCYRRFRDVITGCCTSPILQKAPPPPDGEL